MPQSSFRKCHKVLHFFIDVGIQSALYIWVEAIERRSMKYLKRIVDNDLQARLESMGAVLIVGPKWCGKTTTAEQQASSVLRLNDPDMREAYLATAQVKPSNLLKGSFPRLIDEWQEAPQLWDAIRLSVDESQRPGLYILTGSTTIDRSNIHHTGTGRISRLKMYPMSLYESGESNGLISLSALFDDPDMNLDGIQSNLDINGLIFAACRGGWPSSLTLKTDRAKLFVAKDYFDNICDNDIASVSDIANNPRKTRLLLRSYARNVSTLATNGKIIADVNANAPMSESSFYERLSALERLFVLEDVGAWCPSIRSKTAIRSSNKREFVDPSIAIAALGLSPAYLETDLKTFGFIFECLCIRDLRVYSSAKNGEISYYRDRYGLEADAVLHLDDGRYALIEIKLGSHQIEEGATHLLKLKDIIIRSGVDEGALRAPDLLIILTGGHMAYRRSDGVIVLPIGCLKD